MTNEDTLRTLADILRECSHVDDATNPDVIRACMQRVKAVAQSALHPVTLDLGVAWRNTTVAEAMADTVDAPLSTSPVTDAEWRVQTLQLQRQALDEVQQAERAAGVWRTSSAAAAEQRHLASQDAAQRRHAEQMDAIASASQASPRILALQLLTALPPEWPLSRRHAAMHEALELVLRYPERAGQPLPPKPEDMTPEPSPAPAPELDPAEWPTVKDFTRRRGLNYFYASRAPSKAQEIHTMAEMGATMLRCWLDVTWDAEAGQYVTTGTDRIRDAANLAHWRGMLTVVCLLIPNAQQPWGSPQRTAALVQLWLELEREFRDMPSIVYDLFNEPFSSDTLTGYEGDSAGLYMAVGRHARDAAIACVGAIQAVSPRRLCVVKLGYGADPNAFVDLEPIPMPNVVHSAHMWLPHAYTHHGITQATQGIPLPEPVPYGQEHREALQVAQGKLADWSARHGGLPVYVAETGAHAYLPDAHDYVRDSLTFCAKMGWPASYHEIYGDPVWRPTDAMRQAIVEWMGASKESA